MTVQIVEISGQKMAILPIADYQHLLDIAEDKADALSAFEAEQRRLDGEEYLPAELVDRIIAGESALRVWRKFRKMTLAELSRRSGAAQSFLSLIENGQRKGSPVLWRKLADAMNVSADDILPES